MPERYYVTDRNAIAVIYDYPVTVKGWNKAVSIAAVLAQMSELYPSGITVERRMPNGDIKQIITITSAA